MADGTGGAARTAAAVIVAVLGATAWLVLFVALSWRVAPLQSDHASTVLMGHDVASGNLLLHGWQLPFDGYWSIDVMAFAIATRVLGVSPTAARLVPVVLAATTVALTMAVGLRRTRGMAALTGALVVLAVLGLPGPLLTSTMLQGPMHVGTAALCIAAFAVIRPGANWRRTAVGTIVLLTATVGDPTSVVYGAAAVVVAGLVEAVRARRWRPAAGPVCAGAIAGVAPWIFVRVIARMGGYALAPPLPMSPAGNWVSNIGAFFRFTSLALGSNALAPQQAPSLYPAARLVVCLVLLGAVVVSTVAAVAGLVAPRGRGWTSRLGSIGGGASAGDQESGSTESLWLRDVLVLAFWADAAVYVITVLPHANATSIRYVVPGVVFATALAARLAAAAVSRVRPRLRVLPVAVASAFALAFLVWPVRVARQASPPDQFAALGRWLDGRGLHAGYAPYWQAPTLTVTTGESVRVRTIFLGGDGRFHPLRYMSTTNDDGARSSRFVLFRPGDEWGAVNDATLRAAFGPPDETHDAQGLRVLVWSRDLSPQLGGAADPGEV